MTVFDNVGYHTMGHTFFVEDGGEAQNVFESNLGVFTLGSFAMLSSDVNPATFWMSSPTNYWRNNVAAGSIAEGYWFELPGNPGGPSFTTSICPVNGHILEFSNNVAHSCQANGIKIYPAYFPLLYPCGGPTAPQYITNFTSYHNGGNGVFCKRGGDIHFVNARLIENGNTEFQWNILMMPHTNNPHIVNLLAIATTDPSIATGKRAIWAPQQEGFYVSGMMGHGLLDVNSPMFLGATMVNYRDFGAISACAVCDSDPFLSQGGFTYRFEGLSFVNTTRRTLWTPPYKDIFLDLDGTLTGHVNGSVTEYRPFNVWPECEAQGAVYDHGIVCNSSARIRRMQIDNVNPYQLDFLSMLIESSNGKGGGVITYLPKEISGWVSPMVANHQYNMSFISLIDFFTMRIRYSEPHYLDMPDEWMQLTFNYTSYRYRYDVRNGASGSEVATVNFNETLLTSAQFGTSRLTSNDTWDIMLTVNNSASNAGNMYDRPGPYSVNIEAVICGPGMCDYPAQLPLGPPIPWSDPSTWPTGVLPAANSNVNISAGLYVMLDISPPSLGHVVIYGKLQFQDGMGAIKFTAATILVWGVFQIGEPSNPFQNIGQIVLIGTCDAKQRH